MKTISVIGAGYVGLTTAVVLANSGFKVMMVEKNKEKVDKLKRGESDFFEPGLDLFLHKAISSGRLFFSELSEAIPVSSIAFICVGTPSKKNGELDSTDNLAAITSVLKHAKKGLVIVQKSTVPVGTGSQIMKLIKKTGVFYVANPEFLREGSAIYDTLFCDRIFLGGTDKPAIKKVEEVYRIVDRFAGSISKKNIEEYAFLYIKGKVKQKQFAKKIMFMSLKEAELVKISANSFLAMKISYANFLSCLCEKIGAKSDVVLNALGADERIGRSFLYSGIGFGGSCLPKDLDSLIKVGKDLKVNNDLLKAVKKINDGQILEAVRKIKKHLGDNLRNKKAAVLGLTFKGGTSDLRSSPALGLCKNLLKDGMKITAYNPHLNGELINKLSEKNFTLVTKINDVVSGADVVIVGAEWEEFKLFDYSKIASKLKKKFILDGRNFLNEKKMEKMGFVIEKF
jgi:UDPglucose 6-dehydrogenase